MLYNYFFHSSLKGEEILKKNYPMKIKNLQEKNENNHISYSVAIHLTD